MNQQDRIVLNGLYENASMGWDATCTILPKAEQEKLRTELCKQLEYYKEQKHAAETQLQKACAIPKEQGAMAKLCADLSIQMHCCGSTSSGEIAKLMLKGTNTGVIQITQLLHQNPDISESVRHQSHAMLRHEEAYMDRLKTYL